MNSQTCNIIINRGTITLNISISGGQNISLNLTISEPVVSEPVVSEPVVSEPVVSKPVLSEPVRSEPVRSEPVPEVCPCGLPVPPMPKSLGQVSTTPELEKLNTLSKWQELINKQTDVTHNYQIFEEIKSKLTEIGTNRNIDEKVKYAIELFEYLALEEVNFIWSFTRFKQTVIAKCYELKTKHSDIPNLVKKIDILLTKLNVPLNEKHFKDKVLQLFLNIAEEMEMENVLEDPDFHYDHWNTAINNWSMLQDKPIDEAIEYYFKLQGDLSYHQERIYLMKKLLRQNKLLYTSDIIKNYYEWEKTADLTNCKNRYQKMCKFITENEHLIAKKQ
jgi:hypothetical protein